MAVYDIFNGDEMINTIVASEDFCASYCEKNGYTFAEIVAPDPEPVPDPEPTDAEILNILLGVEE